MNAPDRAGCPATRHGTALAYQVDRCRCDDARETYRIYRKRLREARYEPDRVDSTGTARRLQALAAIGWPAEHLAVRLGCSDVAVQQWRRRRHPAVYRRTADRVAALYEQLSGTPGPSPITRDRARRAGWAPPLLWDGIDLDDPGAEPHDDTASLPPRLDLDEVEHLARYGVPLDEIAARLGVRATSIERARQRAVARGRAA
jgi:hypothetical protein